MVTAGMTQKKEKGREYLRELLDEESFEGATQQVDSQIISRSC